MASVGAMMATGKVMTFISYGQISAALTHTLKV
jgi:hypothetical protein